jgi:hypothetical protein
MTQSIENFSAYSPRPPAGDRIWPDTAGQRQQPPPVAYPQARGCFRRWWQVLGSNQRRLSRRFTDGPP